MRNPNTNEPILALARAVLLLSLILASTNLHAQDRVALLITNSDYGQQKLPETKQDVETLAAALRDAGFVVTVKENVGKSLRQDIESFAQSCPDGGVSLLYFAGFGNQFQRKVSTTVTKPDGSKEKVESLEWATGVQPVEGSHYLLSDLARAFRERSTARLHLLLLDCAYAKKDLPKSEKQGMLELTPSDFPSTMICCAMPPKQTLPDGASSQLATSLVKHIAAKDQTIGETMRLVQNDVSKLSSGKQELWYAFSLESDANAEVVSSRKRNIHTTKLPPTNPKAGDEWINGLGMVFVWCPPGSFRMGLPESAHFDTSDAQPVDVNISQGFWIGKYEMAYGTYHHRLKKGPSGTPLVEHGNVPMTFIKGPQANDAGKLIAGVEGKLDGFPAAGSIDCRPKPNGNTPAAREVLRITRSAIRRLIFIALPITRMQVSTSLTIRSTIAT